MLFTRPTGHRHHYWRVFFVALLVAVVVGAVVTLLFPGFAGLFVLGLYCIPTNSIFPLPHEPGILYFARLYDPLWISITATAASSIMAFADYAMVEAAMKHPRIASIKNTRLFQWALRWMKRWPFAIVALFSFIPLPITIIRILAPASHYPIGRYILAQAVGRLPRFYALALIGHFFEIPTWVLIALFVALFALFFLTGRSSRDPSSQAPVSQERITT